MKQKQKRLKKARESIKHIPLESSLENLTQVEEMLIARALPVTHVYLKPGGQRGYSGHCINLPQNVTELVNLLPRYPKDLSVIVVKIKGKDNNYKGLGYFGARHLLVAGENRTRQL